MMDEPVSMVQECVDKYYAQDREDGGVDIFISVPKRFHALWLIKLSELRATSEEIRQYEDTADNSSRDPAP